MADHDPPTEDEQPKKEEGAARKKVVTFNITDPDPPTEDEQPKKEEGAAHKKGSSQSHDSTLVLRKSRPATGIQNPGNLNSPRKNDSL